MKLVVPGLVDVRSSLHPWSLISIEPERIMIFQVDSHETEPGVLCVALAGEIDMSAEEQLGNTITGAILNDRITTLHIDLGAVTFLDASGIGIFVRGSRLAEQHGISYRIVNARGIVKQVFTITGVLDALTGHDTSDHTA